MAGIKTAEGEVANFRWARCEITAKGVFRRQGVCASRVHPVSIGRRDRPTGHDLYATLAAGHGPEEQNSATAHFAQMVIPDLKQAMNATKSQRGNVRTAWKSALARLYDVHRDKIDSIGATAGSLHADASGIDFLWAGDVALWCLEGRRAIRLNTEHTLSNGQELRDVLRAIFCEGGTVGVDLGRLELFRFEAGPFYTRLTRCIGAHKWRPLMCDQPEYLRMNREEMAPNSLFVLASSGFEPLLHKVLEQGAANGPSDLMVRIKALKHWNTDAACAAFQYVR